MRAFCRRALTQAGHTIVEAEDGVVALREFRDAPVDVIVCDIYMPEMDGFELIRILRREAPHVPVIAVSGVGSAPEDTLKLASRLGAARVLLKPFKVDELTSAVADALGGPQETASQ